MRCVKAIHQVSVRPLIKCSSADSISEQRETYFQEFLFYVDSMRQEQRLKDSGIIPSLEDYLRLRIGSSAVGQVYGLSEYAMRGQQMPPNLFLTLAQVQYEQKNS